MTDDAKPSNIRRLFAEAPEVSGAIGGEEAAAAPQTASDRPRTTRRRAPVSPRRPNSPEDMVDRPEGWLPDDFPVIPLGVDGRTCWFIDERGALQDLQWEKITRANIEGLMGRHPELLEVEWPSWKEKKVKGEDSEWIITGWKPDAAARALKAACALKGGWSPDEKVRGRGTWCGLDGELIVHYGDCVMVYPIDGSAPFDVGTGEYEGMVYPSAAPLPKPAAKREPANAVGKEILDELMGWNWTRPDVDPYLYLGQLVAGILGGALAWRPLEWTTGGAGTGKSSLMKFKHGLLGDWVLSTSDTTAAGIWQKLGFDSRPVMIDEAEAEDNPERARAILQLGRMAASGAVIFRGGNDHKGHQFTSRSTFDLSSVTMPPLKGTDRSRTAILQLRKLPANAPEPALDRRRLETVGRRVLRRVVDQWPRFQQTLELYRDAMKRAGHSGRGADVYGTLLACQDVLRFDDVPDSDSLADWGDWLKAGNLAELVGDMAVEAECLLHLTSQTIENGRTGNRHALGDWLEQAAAIHLRPNDPDARKDSDVANKLLRLYGIKVDLAPLYSDTKLPKWPGLFVWIAYRHVELGKLFTKTKWQSATDAVGGWVQHLAWLPGVTQNIPFYCGVQTKAVLVPIELCIRPGDDASGSEPPIEPSAAGRSPTPVEAEPLPNAPASGRRAADSARSKPPPDEAVPIYDDGDPGPSSPEDYL